MIQGFCFSLADLDPDKVGFGFATCMTLTVYAVLAATGFLLADIREPGTVSPPVSPVSANGDKVAGSLTDEAKKIIDNVVERERR
jgi:hypothetical protein